MFSTAITYLHNYRLHREAALQNKERAAWFTAPVDSFPDLFTVFDSSAENAAWDKITATGGALNRQVNAIRKEIAFLTSCYHDLRGQFAVSAEAQPKTMSDFDRHAISDTLYADYMTSRLNADITLGLAGAGK